MATAPRRCSQCGTINEPVANSCRTCGKWPSLFDLEDSVVDEGVSLERAAEPEPEGYAEPPPPPAVEAPEPVTVELETYEPPEPAGMSQESRRLPFEPPPTDPVVGEGETGTPRWVSWIIPIAVIVFFALQFFLGDRG